MGHLVTLYRGVIYLGAALFLVSCIDVRLHEELSDYDEEVEQLQRRVTVSPNDADALRDLGAIYVRTDHVTRAVPYLKKAFSYEPADPKTLFYIGLASELLANEQTALRFYERYSDISRTSIYRGLMEGRYRWLLRQMAQQEIRTLLAREEELTQDRVVPNAVAVFPFAYRGENARFAPLGRGLAEMVTVDLVQVPELRVLERVRVQALVDELELQDSAGVIDQSTAVRGGRVLGAGRIIGGYYDILDQRTLHLGAAVWEQNRQGGVETTPDVLDNLFQLQTELVFQLIDEMGVDLTPAQRAAIEDVPTQNLQAFLAYSRGLIEEDAGDFAAAAGHFRRAVELDPGFEAAARQGTTADNLSQTAGSAEEALAAAGQVDGPQTLSVDPLNDRLEKLSARIRSNFMPGEDSRDPAQEARSMQLPPPPQPPPR